ncbi:MAG: response regulator [Chloroflexota bacterium]
MKKPFALIIEDHVHTATIFSAALKQVGYETKIVHDGLNAHDTIKLMSPDVVVLDLHLPHMSGEQLLDQIRADERLTKTKVILASADPLLAKELEQDADLVLVKPISFDQLSLLSRRLMPESE